MGRALARDPRAVEAELGSKWFIDRMTALKGAMENWDAYSFLLDQFGETRGLNPDSAKELLEEYSNSLEKLRATDASKAGSEAHAAHIH